MRKLLVLGAGLILAGAGCSSDPVSKGPSGGISGAPATLTNASVASTTYSMADVQAANTPEKCWTAVRGKVYNLTPAENVHPGGKQAILNLCGKDGTKAFENKHGGKEKPENALNGLQIGVLK